MQINGPRRLTVRSSGFIGGLGMKQWIVKIAVAAAMGVAMVAGITSPAYAANTVVDVVWQDILRGDMVHIDDGDDFRVYDRYKDGWGVKGILQGKGAFGEWVTMDSTYNNKGAGSYTQFEFDILAVSDYRMRVCLHDDGANDPEPLKCVTKLLSE
jgi:hypothetical protein